MASPRYCGNCGQVLREGARFCPACGGEVRERDAAGQSQVPSAPVLAAPAPAPAQADFVQTPAVDVTSAPEPDATRADDTIPPTNPPVTLDNAPLSDSPTAPRQVPSGRADSRPRSSGRQEPVEPDYYTPPGPAAPPDSSLQPSGGPRSRAGWIIAAAVVLILAGGGGAAYAVLGSHHKSPGHTAGSQSGTRKSATPTATTVVSPTPSPTPTPSATSTVPSRQQAATDLAGLLAQSGTDRTQVTQAVADVSTCGGSLSQDESVFTNAATSRQTLLGELASLPDRSALPAPMLQDLTNAWQASMQADRDFAAWTQDEISRGCSTDVQADPNYQAATTPDDQATHYKMAFVNLWTPIASQYGLPQYQYNEI
jgi:hypothetical protein